MVYVILHKRGGPSCILFNRAAHVGSTIGEVGVRDNTTYKLIDQVEEILIWISVY